MRKSHSVGMYVIVILTIILGQTSAPIDSTIDDFIARSNLPSTLSISSLPVGAEIYLDKKPGKRICPDAYTPATFTNIKKKEIMLTLFKKGYSDTTLYLDIAPATTRNINIIMVPPPVQALQAQDQFLQDRSYTRIGKYCIISSPVFLAAGAGFFYFSEKNRKNAQAAKEDLDKSIVRSGDWYDAKQKQYTDESYKKNSKIITGIVLSGLAAIDLAFGIVFYF